MKKILLAILIALTPVLATAQYFGPIYTPGAVNITGGTIVGASINNSIIGSTTPAAATFTSVVSPTLTGTLTGSITGNAATVTTNANLTGPITSNGNATSVNASQPSITSVGTLTSVTVSGQTAGGAGSYTVPSFSLGSSKNDGIFQVGEDYVGVTDGANTLCVFGLGGAAQYGINCINGIGFSTEPRTVSADTAVVRTSAGVLEINNGTVGQFRDLNVRSTTVSGTLTVGSTSILPNLVGTTGSIGGGALLAGACTSGTVSITNSTTAMAVIASPVTYPGDGGYWMGYVSSAGTVTVKVCAAVAMTPTAGNYNVRVIQ